MGIWLIFRYLHVLYDYNSTLIICMRYEYATVTNMSYADVFRLWIYNLKAEMRLISHYLSLESACPIAYMSVQSLRVNAKEHYLVTHARRLSSLSL